MKENLNKNISNMPIFLIILFFGFYIYTDNQTAEVTPVLVNQKFPFTIKIELADFQLSMGLQSGVKAVYNDKWLLLCGRTNGLHGFENSDDFPRSKQNTTVFVVDPITRTVKTRSLLEPKSALNQDQIDSLSVVSPQYYVKGNTLYITGGYGVISSSGDFSTKDILTAIDIPGLMEWVLNPRNNTTAAQFIRQISNPVFRVTGGAMFKIKKNPTLLVFGQDFEGQYNPGSNGIYTRQVRRFNIIDDGNNLDVEVLDPDPIIPDPNFRRRDLNVVQTISVDTKTNNLNYGLVALSGVFVPGNNGGVWTVPVTITGDGHPTMADLNLPGTFKQAMNNYASSHVALFSNNLAEMYMVLFGGITFGFFENGQFMTDSGIPFTSEVTAIKIDTLGNFSQYLMNEEFPALTSKSINFGNRLLFGAGAFFVSNSNISSYANNLLDYDSLKNEPTVIGYIVGGIQSTKPNTKSRFDSSASPYIFKVTVIPDPSFARSKIARAIILKYCI